MLKMISSDFFLFWLLLLTTQTDQIDASHFRGGLISWRPLNPQPDEGETVTLEISWRVSWRRSAYGCTDATIANSILSRGEGSLVCSCSGPTIPLSYFCTDYSSSEDWTTGINTATYTASETSFALRFSGYSWLSLINNRGGTWRLIALADTAVRDDTGMVNSAPLTVIAPVIPFKNGCTNTLMMPVLDVDGDDIRCFWATNCGAICGPVSGFTLDSDKCELVLLDTSVVLSGLYGIALEIRDFANEASTTPLSQTPVQFLLHVKSTPGTCSEIPMFIAPTAECGSCVSVPAGTTYNGQLVARSPGPTVSIASIETVSPSGFTKSDIMPYTAGQPTDYFIDVTWDPDNVGVLAILCFLARDSNGNASPFCCVTLSSFDSPPEVVSNSLTPASGSTVVAGNLKMQLQFNDEISRPTVSAFISVFDETDTMVFQVDASDDTQVDFLENDVIAFIIPADDFTEGSYYVTIDAAVALLISTCTIESAAVTDTSFWTFTIMAPWDFHCFVTPPVRNLRSMKPVELLAVAGGGPDAFTTTFRGRDHGEFYSNGMFVSYEATLGASSTDGDTLRIYKSTLLEPENECSKAKRFGVHFCDYFSTIQRFSAQVLIHNQEALIPRNAIRTVVVSTGETLTLCINPNIPKTWKGPIAWSFDGRDPLWLHRWTGSTCIHVKHIQTCQAGVYEAYRRICGRKEKQHAYFDVRVRACPDGFHTPPACTGTCPATCVLGYCGDDGQCLCRNGLTGENCDIANRGQFGLIDGDIPCATVGLDADCKGSLMCSHHAGCSCAPGWKGMNCDEECEALTWGPDCVFSCNGGTSCDRFTGV